MTDELFREDSYVFEFEAEVTAVKGDYVTLGGTAFYPGGGGQVCDTGTICGRPVTEVKYEGNEIVHKVPGHDFKVGDKMWCSVDWERRYDLMKGHTAEHLLFNSLHRQDPEIGIVKIFISPENKYVIVNHDISWEKIGAAVEFANTVISENHSVIKSVMSRDDPDIEKIRVKLDRIEEDEIDVVEIEDVDLAACCGIHVMETEELGAIFVYKKLSAGKEGVEIHFKVGDDALRTSMSLATSCLSIIDELGSKPEDIVKTVGNMKHELESSKKQLKASVSTSLKNIEPQEFGGVKVYAGTFPTSDRGVLTDAAESYKKNGGVAAFIGVGETLTVMLASGSPKVDCKKIVSETLTEFGGRGGGKPDFSHGGIPDVSVSEKVLSTLLDKVKQSLA